MKHTNETNHTQITWFNTGRELSGRKLFPRWGLLLLFKESVVGARLKKTKKKKPIYLLNYIMCKIKGLSKKAYPEARIKNT